MDYYCLIFKKEESCWSTEPTHDQEEFGGIQFARISQQSGPGSLCYSSRSRRHADDGPGRPEKLARLKKTDLCHLPLTICGEIGSIVRLNFSKSSSVRTGWIIRP